MAGFDLSLVLLAVVREVIATPPDMPRPARAKSPAIERGSTFMLATYLTATPVHEMIGHRVHLRGGELERLGHCYGHCSPSGHRHPAFPEVIDGFDNASRPTSQSAPRL